jgi:hypothetical protein
VKIVSPTPDDEGLASEPQFPKWNRKQRFVADQNVRLESRGHHGTIRKIARDLNPRQLQSSLRVVYMTKEGVADPAPDFHIQVITLFKIVILIAERRRQVIVVLQRISIHASSIPIDPSLRSRIHSTSGCREAPPENA